MGRARVMFGSNYNILLFIKIVHVATERINQMNWRMCLSCWHYSTVVTRAGAAHCHDRSARLGL